MQDISLDASIDTTDKTTEQHPQTLSEPLANGDRHIWGIYIALCLISVIELYSASSREVASSAMGVFGPIIRHVAMLIAGLFIVLGLQRSHYRYFYSSSVLFVMISIALMVWCLIGGEIVNGARRNVNLLILKLQPSEFIKMSAVLLIAIIAQRTQMKGGGVSNKGVAWMAGCVMLFGALLIKQGLTNTLLLMGISGAMFLIGGVQWRKLTIVAFVYLACFGVFFLISTLAKGGDDDKETAAIEQTLDGSDIDRANATAGERHHTWLARVERYRGDGRPKYEHEITANNRQEMYAFMAQANGGIFGVGPGNSREAARLPLAFSDYIYSIIVEDTGLVGGLVVLILYLWLLARAATIASRCTRAFPALLVLGMAVMIVMQALIHIAIVTGAAPVSGQPLPLISKGGTSILITSIAFGVMLSVSRHTARTGKRQEIKRELESLPEDLRTANPTQL
ncbi:MAG: FtsW/RodA/SpoVE family cell cycle protein [Paramuribaculum sp.]|nr:FtsW/RodA/SpoVE family cell cycle protein [Bacteroides sp.]MDE6825356.1 FtsW/RodA/SpoVE family cell cycle protein [Paramuribaculum sp.]